MLISSAAPTVIKPRKRVSALRVVAAVILGILSFSLLVPSGIVVILMGIRVGLLDEKGLGTVVHTFGNYLGNAIASQIPFVVLLMGLSLVGTIVFMFLRPRRVRVPLVTSASAPVTTDATAESRKNPKNTVNSTVAQPSETVTSPYPAADPNGIIGLENKPIQVYHTRIMGSTFAEDGDRRVALAGCAVGDILALRTKTAESGASVVVFHTVKGATLGLMDASLARTIREVYPGHRIGAVIERMEGGGSRPCMAHVAVTVYRTAT